MKSYMILLFLFFLNSTTIYCQKITAENAGAVRQKISVKQFQGKKISLQATIKVAQIEDKAGAILFLKVQTETKQPGAVAYSSSPIFKNSWSAYTVDCTLDNNADSLSFGCIFSGKAIYAFDNFILRADGEIITISDWGFESDDKLLNSPWSIPVLPKNFTAGISNQNVFEGKNSLVIDGSGGSPVNKFGDDASAGKFASINGVEIYYEVYGKGEPLLLLHGNQQAIKTFTSQIAEFSKYYKVIAVDTRGQGKSSYDDRNYSYDLFADDMNQLLTRLQIDSVNIVGWSDGGNTGLIMAMKFPVKVKRLVTMGANIFIDESVVAKETIDEISTTINQLKKDTAAASINSMRLYNMLLKEPHYKYEQLKSITCPVLVMAGENDIIKEEHTKKIAANITRAKLLIVPKETHYYPVNNSKGFNEMVVQFLKEK